MNIYLEEVSKLTSRIQKELNNLENELGAPNHVLLQAYELAKELGDSPGEYGSIEHKAWELKHQLQRFLDV